VQLCEWQQALFFPTERAILVSGSFREVGFIDVALSGIALCFFWTHSLLVSAVAIHARRYHGMLGLIHLFVPGFAPEKNRDKDCLYKIPRDHGRGGGDELKGGGWRPVQRGALTLSSRLPMNPTRHPGWPILQQVTRPRRTAQFGNCVGKEAV